MADTSILEKYPVVQLLDNLNNPVSPAVQIDSLYEDPGTKNPLDVIYKYDSINLGLNNLHIEKRTDGGTIMIQKEYNNNAPDTAHELFIVTDTWAGDGPNEGDVYNVDNTLHVRKYNASELLTYWFEHDYLSKQAGSPVYFGTTTQIPDAIENNMVSDSAGENVSNYDVDGAVSDLVAAHPVFNSSVSAQWFYGKTMKQDGNLQFTPIYKVVDFNTTSFFAPDLYPKRGIINPSGEYIWFVINFPDGVTARPGSVKLYGFSGEDSPQEIDITPINNMSNAYRSTGKFGIDTRLNMDTVDTNSNPTNSPNDGLSYHIFVKYIEQSL